MEPGQRVKISINKPEIWVGSAVNHLNGRTGIIERVKENHSSENNILVHFDTPAPTWWRNQTPWTAGWFNEKDLLIEEKGYLWKSNIKITKN